MKKRNIVYTVSGFGQQRRVVAKTPGAAVYLFRRMMRGKARLAGGGFKYISVDPSLPPIHRVAEMLKPVSAKESAAA